jgi:hypothetical protein
MTRSNASFVCVHFLDRSRTRATPQPQRNNDENTTTTQSHTCPPIRPFPCRHVIGAPCLQTWLRVNRLKDATCLQFMQEFAVKSKTGQRVKMVLGHRAVRYVEKLMFYGWWLAMAI